MVTGKVANDALTSLLSDSLASMGVQSESKASKPMRTASTGAGGGSGTNLHAMSSAPPPAFGTRASSSPTTGFAGLHINTGVAAPTTTNTTSVTMGSSVGSGASYDHLDDFFGGSFSKQRTEMETAAKAENTHPLSPPAPAPAPAQGNNSNNNDGLLGDLLGVGGSGGAFGPGSGSPLMDMPLSPHSATTGSPGLVGSFDILQENDFFGGGGGGGGGSLGGSLGGSQASTPRARPTNTNANANANANASIASEFDLLNTSNPFKPQHATESNLQPPPSLPQAATMEQSSLGGDFDILNAVDPYEVRTQQTGTGTETSESKSRTKGEEEAVDFLNGGAADVPTTTDLDQEEQNIQAAAAVAVAVSEDSPSAVDSLVSELQDKGSNEDDHTKQSTREDEEDALDIFSFEAPGASESAGTTQEKEEGVGGVGGGNGNFTSLEDLMGATGGAGGSSNANANVAENSSSQPQPQVIDDIFGTMHQPSACTTGDAQQGGGFGGFGFGMGLDSDLGGGGGGNNVVLVAQEEGEEGEPEIRKKLREKRIQGVQKRMAQALEEARERETIEALEKAERSDLAQYMGPKLDSWAKGKNDNIRALLSTLQDVLWEGSGWKQVSMMDLMNPAQVKKNYRKAMIIMHPDKVKQKGGTTEQIFIADYLFDLTNSAWGHFQQSEM